MAFSFKEMVANDVRSTFLNLEEFGEEHRVEGKTITAVMDENALKERQGGQELSVAESSLLLYAAVEDLPARRPAGEGLAYFLAQPVIKGGTAHLAGFSATITK